MINVSTLGLRAGAVLFGLCVAGAAWSGDHPPVAVDDILLACPFVLDNPFRSSWQKERPFVKSGYLVVLRADPELITPRAVPTPVLYAGDTTVEWIDIDRETGMLVGIIGRELDLRATPLWFGSPNYAESVDQVAIAADRKRADEHGIKPFATYRVEGALTQGGSRMRFKDKMALLRHANSLLPKFRRDGDAPQNSE